MATEKPTFFSNNAQEGLFKSSIEGNKPKNEQLLEEKESEQTDTPIKKKDRYFASSIAPSQRITYYRADTYPVSKRITELLYVIGIVTSLALGIRFILQLVGALNVGFASFIYQVTNPIVQPFQIFTGSQILTGTGRISLETILAIFFVVSLTILLVSLVRILDPTSEQDL